VIRKKTIDFDLDKEEDMVLWEWLQKQPHGWFSELTKRVWRDTMEKNIQVDQFISRDQKKPEKMR